MYTIYYKYFLSRHACLGLGSNTCGNLSSLFRSTNIPSNPTFTSLCSRASGMRMESISELQVPLIRIIDDNDVAVLHVEEPAAPDTPCVEEEGPSLPPRGFMHTLDVPGHSYSAAQRRQDSYRFVHILVFH